MGAEAVKHFGHYRKLDGCPKPMGVPGSCVCGRGHSKTAAQGENQAANHAALNKAHLSTICGSFITVMMIHTTVSSKRAILLGGSIAWEVTVSITVQCFCLKVSSCTLPGANYTFKAQLCHHL